MERARIIGEKPDARSRHFISPIRRWRSIHVVETEATVDGDRLRCLPACRFA